MDHAMLEYNALDAACTMEVHDAIWEDLSKQGYQKTYELTIRLFEPLLFMATRGIRVDSSAMEHTKREIQKAQADAERKLNEIAGRELNALSPKQVSTYFYIEKGVIPYRNKDGGVTTDDKAMQRLSRPTSQRPAFPEAKLIQDIRGYNKLYSTYLDINFDADGRLRCAYNPRGTKFGRLSSSETVFGTGTNQQNLPQEFKQFLVPDEGYFFLEVDKRQAEWVVVAYLSGDANMITVLQQAKDPHTHTASLMFNLDPELIAYENKIVGNLSDPDEIYERRMKDPRLKAIASKLPRTMSARQCGKKSNHGLNYDEGFRTFSLTNEIEEREGKRIVELYHTIYPGIRNHYYEWIKKQLYEDRTLTNCFGRKVRFLDMWGDTLFKAAYSCLPQSTVVDGLNSGLVQTYHDTDLTRRLNIDILAQVHDSILFQFPLQTLGSPHQLFRAVEKIYKYCSPRMEYFGRDFVIPTDMKIGMNWGGYHPEKNPMGMKEIKPWSSVADFTKRIKDATAWQ